MWRNTGQPVRLLMLDARACLPILSVMVYWSWPTLYIAIIGVTFFSTISLFGLTLPAMMRLIRRWLVGSGANGRAGLEPAAVRMSAVNVEAVGRTTAGAAGRLTRPILYRDPATGTRSYRSTRRPSPRRLGSCRLSWSPARRSGARRPARVSRWT